MAFSLWLHYSSIYIQQLNRERAGSHELRQEWSREMASQRAKQAGEGLGTRSPIAHDRALNNKCLLDG